MSSLKWNSRWRTRKFLYQMLYASTFSNISNKEDLKYSFFESVFNSVLDEDYLQEMFDIVIKNEDFLINIIEKYAPKFKIKDMDLAAIFPIFIWVWELLFCSIEIPVKVSLNEAILISKTYWDTSSKKIVHWVMSSVIKDLDELNKLKENYTSSNKEFLFKK